MTNDALRTIFPIAGWGEERARAVEITGGTDPILPTSFRIAETSAAALAATGLAVSDLWQLRTGRRQDVAVPLELSPLQFPEPSCGRPRCARRAGRSRGGARGSGEVGRARARGGDHRREGRRRYGANHGRMGQAPASRRDRIAAAD